MIGVVQRPDGLEARLRLALRERAAREQDAWTMSRAPKRSAGHGLFQYPAMMLPDLQGALLDDLLAVDPALRRVLDPFAGSGTVLLEALRRGLEFRGLDLNPLAVLLCAVKSRTYGGGLEADFSRVLGEAQSCSSRCGAAPEGTSHWFVKEVLAQLTCLRGAIRRIEDQDVRRVLWVALAETVRLTSNSRTSTVKLHRLPAEVLAARSVDAFSAFEQVSTEHLRQLSEQTRLLAAGAERAGTRLSVTCKVGDARKASWPDGPADVLMTSPPYGDNRTTVTYGQHSYLPLLWIDHEDIPGEPERPVNTYGCDGASLGGRLRGSLDAGDRLRAASPSFAETATALESADRNAQQRLCAFFRDLDDCLNPVLAGLRDGGWLLWTLGERRIAGVPVPMVAIVRELLTAKGVRDVTALNRRIPAGRKRMAPRNGISDTMTKETVLVMRKHPSGHREVSGCGPA